MSDIVERAQRWMREYSIDVRIRVCLEECVNEIGRLEANFAEANLAREYFIQAIRAATIEECAEKLRRCADDGIIGWNAAQECIAAIRALKE